MRDSKDEEGLKIRPQYLDKRQKVVKKPYNCWLIELQALYSFYISQLAQFPYIEKFHHVQ